MTEFLNSPEPTHGWGETLYDQHSERDRLFQLVASLANIWDKALVVETVKSVLGIEPVEMEDCVFFDGLTIKFGDDGRVTGLYHTFDGTTEPAKSIIQDLSNDGRGN